MFNFYQSERRSKSICELVKKEQNDTKKKKLHKVRQAQLIQNYNERVDSFLQTMMSNPIKLETHVEPLQIVPRESDPTKYKGNAIFICKGFKTQKQRLKESSENNKFLDLHPIDYKHEFRTREENKEINQRMYYKPRTGIERVQDILNNNRFISNDRSADNLQSFDNSRSHSSMHMKSSIEAIKPKQLWSELHQKTHFNAVTSVMIGSYTKEDPISSLDNIGLFTSSALKSNPELKRRPTLTIEETRTLARKVLEECKVRKKKRDGYLLKGTGHLISNPELNNTQVYTTIFKDRSGSVSNFLSTSAIY